MSHNLEWLASGDIMNVKKVCSIATKYNTWTTKNVSRCNHCIEKQKSVANEKSVTVKKYKSTPSWDQGWVVVTLCVSELINCCPTVESSRLSICHPYFKFLFSYFSVSPKLAFSNIFYMHLILFPTSQVPLLQCLLAKYAKERYENM